ncbi:MAG: bifunctional methionine sulfoxide reductase B/A protein [Shewanella sp.]|nr:bifunctional methionine sulfoxide reductase B/A protein [Shewanella sp.]MCF1431490.1 bifunctional methionine sulfoxide reductase B/A protein [Shewanella sp.]MCF1439332.1 bifunctional methionine sulfoxide reductase B/A protein [Shewanella sp.]MCF1459531.1 bifunctional methionine sulfoxide reductase B/A protein [Shewanella sp.]
MRKLTDFERYVIEEKGTERPFSGEYHQFDEPGVYHCRKCDAPLYLSEHKFQTHCGWPAFDDEIPGAVTRHPDADGRRTEIVCAACGGHLGHVFEGEYLTEKNLRHCVNSASMVFRGKGNGENQTGHIELATLGGGCFWCIEAIFAVLQGVAGVKSGYAGGDPARADYRSVCSGDTGHAEVVQVSFDPEIISYRELLQVFFTSHDPTTLNRQGNDKGTQYRSVIFAHNALQQEVAAEVIGRLDASGLWSSPLVTELVPYTGFYPAEEYHNDYFARNPDQGYCRVVVAPKVDKVKGLFADKLKS